MAIDPVSSVSVAISNVAKLLVQTFNGENREQLAKLRRIKRREKALNVAEELIGLVGPLVSGSGDEDLIKEFSKLKRKFEKYD